MLLAEMLGARFEKLSEPHDAIVASAGPVTDLHHGFRRLSSTPARENRLQWRFFVSEGPQFFEISGQHQNLDLIVYRRRGIREFLTPHHCPRVLEQPRTRRRRSFQNLPGFLE